MPKEKIITAIDIGSTKISTIVAAVSENKVSVIGVSGNVTSKGIDKGKVVDIDSAVEAISESLDRAERMAGVSVSSAFVTVNGSHIQCLNSHGVVAVAQTPNSEISSSDVERVIDAAQAVSLPSTREIVHVIPSDFIVDSQEGIKDPIGMQGVRLEVETNVIHAASIAMRNIVRCVSQVGVNVEEIVYTGVASAEAVLTETEKELGTLLVDIGGGTTSMIAYINGSPVHSAVLPIGGRYITTDLTIGLRARLEDAEKIKLKLSNDKEILKLKDKKNEEFDVSEFGLDTPTVPLPLLYKIIEARLEEIFRLIALEVAKAGLTGKLPAGLVLTGGAALTAGAERVAKVTLKVPVRIGIPQGVTGLIDDIQGPDSSAAIGALLYGVHLVKSGNRLSFDEQKGNIGKSLINFFKKLKLFLP